MQKENDFKDLRKGNGNNVRMAKKIIKKAIANARINVCTQDATGKYLLLWRLIR